MLVHAEALTRLGEPARAAELMSIARKGGADDVALQPRIHKEQARVHYALGEFEAAQTEVETGLAIAREYELAHEESRLLWLAADIAQALGQEDKAAEATESAIRIETELGIRQA
jgi:tetratricopeptide (TPR) repeat protein